MKEIIKNVIKNTAVNNSKREIVKFLVEENVKNFALKTFWLVVKCVPQNTRPECKEHTGGVAIIFRKYFVLYYK